MTNSPPSTLAGSPPDTGLPLNRPPAWRKQVPTTLLGAGILALIIVSCSFGALDTTMAQTAQIISGHLLPGMPWMSNGALSVAQDQAVWNFRLPRTLLAGVAGACLALAGALLQTNVRNPLAEPYILGISSGAGVGAVLSIVLGSTAVAGLSLNTAAFLGAPAATALVYLLARQGGVILPTRLILAGVALGSLLAAITNFLTITTEAQNVYSVLFFLLGSVSAASYEQLLLPALALLGVGLYAGFKTRALNAMLAGDEMAMALGVNVTAMRRGADAAQSPFTGPPCRGIDRWYASAGLPVLDPGERRAGGQLARSAFP